MRDVLKTLSYGTLHLTIGFTVAYLLTGEVDIAAGIALIEPLVNTVVFFFHEKAWRVGEAAERLKSGFRPA